MQGYDSIKAVFEERLCKEVMVPIIEDYSEAIQGLLHPNTLLSFGEVTIVLEENLKDLGDHKNVKRPHLP